MRSYHRSIVVLAMVWMVVGAVATPVRRSPDLEARRRSAIDRNMIRFGRSYPAELTAAEIREAFLRSNRRGNSFVRFGRSQNSDTITSDNNNRQEAYFDNPLNPLKRIGTNFVRLGRDPKFIRFGRSSSEEKPTYEQPSELVINGYQQRKGRARDHFLRLGRDNEEFNDTDMEEEQPFEDRRKRSAECHDCHM